MGKNQNGKKIWVKYLINHWLHTNVCHKWSEHFICNLLLMNQSYLQRYCVIYHTIASREIVLEKRCYSSEWTRKLVKQTSDYILQWVQHVLCSSVSLASGPLTSFLACVIWVPLDVHSKTFSHKIFNIVFIHIVSIQYVASSLSVNWYWANSHYPQANHRDIHL